MSNTLVPGGGFRRKRNLPGTPFAADDPYTFDRARALQKGPTVILTPPLAQVVAEALVEAACSRGWRILRGAVMRDHVHVVVTDCADDGPGVRRVLKGRSQAALSRCTGRTQRWWTSGGSERYKHGDRAAETAVYYDAQQAGALAEIVDMQVRIVPGPPG